MKYYQLKESINKKVIGVNDGGVQARMIDSKWDHDELNRYVNEYLFGIWDVVAKIWKGEQVIPPTLDYIQLRPKAILTDFLTFSEPYAGGNYLISQKVKSILKVHHLDYRFYPVTSLWQFEKAIHGYSNLHLIPLNSRQALDFEKSEFFYGSKLIGKKFRYPKSYDEYYKISREERLLLFESLHFNSSIIGDRDMFSIDLAASIIFISERLKTAFEFEEVSGINIVESTEPTLHFSN